MSGIGRPDRSSPAIRKENSTYVQNSMFWMYLDVSIRGSFMPSNEFLRVSMLFPSCLDVSVLVFDNI